MSRVEGFRALLNWSLNLSSRTGTPPPLAEVIKIPEHRVPLSPPTYGLRQPERTRRRSCCRTMDDSSPHHRSFVQAGSLSAALRWCFGLLASLLAIPLSAQQTGYEIHPDYVARQWTAAEGLPVNAVTSVYKDEAGYLWLTTFDGLVRFDGTQFTIINASNTPGLPNNRFRGMMPLRSGAFGVVTELLQLVLYQDDQFIDVMELGNLQYPLHFSHEAPDGRIWMGNEDGVYIYDQGQVYQFEEDRIEEPVHGRLEDSTGRLWFWTHARGLIRLDTDRTMQRITMEQGLPSNHVRDVTEADDGTLWISTDQGVVWYKDGVFTPLTHQDGTSWTVFTYSTFHDTQGHWWLRTVEGWYIYHSGVIEPYSDDHKEDLILSLEPWIDVQGDLWVTTQRELYRNNELIFSLSSGYINTVFHDDGGNQWVATSEHGVFLLNPSAIRMIGRPEGLPGRNIYTVWQGPEQDIWIGTFDTGDIARWNQGLERTWLQSQGHVPLADILTLGGTTDGTVWAGGGGGLCRIQGNQCVREAAIPLSLTVRALHVDENHLWVGTQNGVFRGQLDADETNWQFFETSNGLTSDWVRAFYPLRDGTLLLGTFGGGVMHFDDERFVPFTKAEGLPSNNVRSFYEDEAGIIWIGTEDQGLIRLEREPGQRLSESRLVTIQQVHGLLDDTIHQILEDDAGRMWMNTNRGIFWAEREMLNAFARGRQASIPVVVYTEAEGLRDREGNGGVQPAGIKAHDGTLWFPTQDGVAVINPALVERPKAPAIVIEHVAADGLTESATGRLIMRPDGRNLTVSYTAPYFNNPAQIRYRYQLEGYDDTWQEVESQRQATYTNLPPGDYTLYVQAGIGGVWHEQPTALRLRQLPFFWESGWFIGLWLLGGVLATYGLFRYRVAQVERRAKALEDIVAERTAQVRASEAQLEYQAEQLLILDHIKSRFFANISHELRTPLTLIVGPLEDLLTEASQAERPTLERMHRNGKRLLRLINQLLDLSRLEAGALGIQPQRQDLTAFLKQLVGAFESMATLQDIRLAFETSVPALEQAFDADKLEKVVLNLLTNAFKFTPSGGSIRVVLSKEDDHPARIAISDTGSGIPKEHLAFIFERFYQVDSTTTRRYEGAGIGLALAKEFIELHGGTIKAESEVGVGTTFIIQLPDVPIYQAVEAPLPEHALPAMGDGALHEEIKVMAPTLSTAFMLPEKENATIVLVVEDNADMRTYIRAQLEGTYEVVEAENGEVGLERAQVVVPDIILSDIMMPKMDGFTMVRALKHDERTSHIPIVFLTAKADTDSRIEGFTTGADAYLAKPFNAAELRARVTNLLEQRQRLRNKYGDEKALTTDSQVPEMSPMDEQFIARLNQILDRHLADVQFGVDAMAEAMSMSPRQLRRKLKALTDETPNILMRRKRIEKAAVLLQEGGSVKEVAGATGFNSLSQFRRAFKDVHGVAPSEYA